MTSSSKSLPFVLIMVLFSTIKYSESSKITKDTPIRASSPLSAVIIKQTIIDSISDEEQNILQDVKVSYGFLNSPVYRTRYYLPGTKTAVDIPEERALRLGYEMVSLLDTEGNKCLNPGQNITLVSDIDVRLRRETTTKVRYDILNNGEAFVTMGKGKTITLKKDLRGRQTVEVSTLVKYYRAIVDKTNCTQVTSIVNGTVVRMYDTNPDSNSSQLSKTVVVVVVIGMSLFMVCLIAIVMFRIRRMRGGSQSNMDVDRGLNAYDMNPKY